MGLGVVIGMLGIVFALKASSIADTMWTRNESLTRHSRLLAAPRSYYLWLCRVGGLVLSAGGAGLAIIAVAHLLT
jgi:cell division protein FtsX